MNNKYKIFKIQSYQPRFDTQSSHSQIFVNQGTSTSPVIEFQPKFRGTVIATIMGLLSDAQLLAQRVGISSSLWEHPLPTTYLCFRIGSLAEYAPHYLRTPFSMEFVGIGTRFLDPRHVPSFWDHRSLASITRWFGSFWNGAGPRWSSGETNHLVGRMYKRFWIFWEVWLILWMRRRFKLLCIYLDKYWYLAWDVWNFLS